MPFVTDRSTRIYSREHCGEELQQARLVRTGKARKKRAATKGSNARNARHWLPDRQEEWTFFMELLKWRENREAHRNRIHRGIVGIASEPVFQKVGNAVSIGVGTR